MSEDYEIPENLYYTKEHEWARIEDNLVVMGITDYAQTQLHEVVYVELPEVGSEVEQMDAIGTVESIKAVSEIYTPVSGRIVEVNRSLEDKPELVNEDPYGEGWIAKIQPTNLEEDLKSLMNAEEYAEYLRTLEE